MQDGTKVEGKILSVTPETVVMEVQASPTIRGEKSFPRADVAKIHRSTQDDIAFEEVAVLVVPPTADDPAVYDALLEQKVRPFMRNYAYSKHIPEARRLAATLEEERNRVASGEIKIDGDWVSTEVPPAKRVEIRGQLQLAKMKEAKDPATALMAFEILEKNSQTSSSYPESVDLALEMISQLRPELTRIRNNLERRTRDQEQGLQLAGEDRRRQMEQGIAQEKAAIQARVERAEKAGRKWLPLLPDSKVLDGLAKLADTEKSRLSKIDTKTLAAGAEAVRRAEAQLDNGDLEGAMTSIEEAQKLWSQHVLLASLKESLKKAQVETDTKAEAEEKSSGP